MGESLFISCGLQLAITVGFLAIHAKMIALAKEHCKHKLACLLRFGRISMHDHVVVHWQRAARLQDACSFYLHHTQPAATVGN